MGEDLTIESLQSIEGYTIKEIEDKPSGFNSHTSTKLADLPAKPQSNNALWLFHFYVKENIV